MDIYNKLNELLIYYQSSRAVGHTHTLIHGVDEQTKGTVILAHNMRFADEIARQCYRATPVSWADLHRLRGLRKPLVIDNSAMWLLLSESVSEIKDLRGEIIRLQTVIASQKPQENLTPVAQESGFRRLWSAARCKWYLFKSWVTCNIRRFL